MSKNCVHKGCGKPYIDESEVCVYHPGPPVFHEGQKGWKCCKPRVLTFDEFLTIPPCTTGAHTDIEDTLPEPTPAPAPDIPSNTSVSLGTLSEALPTPVARVSPNTQTAAPMPTPSPAPPPESEDDEEGVAIGPDASCKRRGCGQGYSGDETRKEEKCVHHPGAPIFHEGSKGWSCCKRRVLEFDQFMNIEGCKTKDRHLFVGKKKEAGEEKLDTVRTDYYQTSTSVIASFYLKKIDKSISSVVFKDSTTVDLDLKTADSKRYRIEFPLFGAVKPGQCKFRILGTKLEITLVKADGASWPVLRADDPLSGEIVQVGRAGRV